MLIVTNKFKNNTMKSKLLSLATIALFAITTISCSKSDEPVATPPVVVPPVVTEVPTTTDGFSWTINGQTTKKTGTKCRYSFYGNSTDIILTPENGGAGFVFKIQVLGKIAGNYPLGNVNTLYYSYSATENLPYKDSNTGSVIITSIANNKCSGTFSASGPGTGVTSMSGTFTNIPFF
jgi:hypothetical protein